MLTKEEEDYYNNFFALCRTEGWKQLESNLKSNLEIVNDISYLSSEKDLFKALGAREVLLSLINFKENTQDSMDALIEERKANESEAL